MRVYDRQLSLSPEVGTKHESSSGLLSPPLFYEKGDNVQDDQKVCAEDEKFIDTSTRSLPRSNRGTRKSTNQNGKTLSARATGNGILGAADCSSQRLDALAYFELSSSTAVESDPDLALCFTPESVRLAAAALWKEMQSSSEFRTYAANKEKPREGKKKKLIWPHKLEFIFCHALVRWPPIGKKKIFYKGKKRGKNELLAEYIKEHTHILYDRKVISSHIQNIRPFFLHNPKVSRYLPFEKRKKTNLNGQQSKHAQIRKGRRGSAGLMRDSSMESKFMQDETQPKIRTLTPYYFEMFVTDPRQGMPAYLHVFTKSNNSSQLPDVQLHDIRSEETLTRSLSKFIESGLPLCQIIVCEASLDILRESLPNGADLGVQFELTSESDLKNYHFQCFTSIFEGRECVDSSSGRVGYDAEGSKRLHKIPFGSNFWAHKMGGFTKSIREIEKKRAVSALKDIKVLDQVENDTETRIAGLIESLSATQEVFAISKIDGHKERVLLVHWTFNYVKRNLDAVTTWRNLDTSQLRCWKSSHAEEFYNSHTPHNVNPGSHDLYGLPENDVATSVFKQLSAYDQCPSHPSLLDFLPEYTTAETDADIAENAAGVAKQAGFTDVATVAAAAPHVSETQGFKNLDFLSTHGSLENINGDSNESSVVEDAGYINAEQSALCIQVGFSQDMYELSQSALPHSKDIVQHLLPQSSPRTLSDGLSQSVSQQNPYYQSQPYQNVHHHDYSYHDLSQHMPRALNMETGGADSDLSCSNWQPDEVVFASNPLRIQAQAHPRSPLQGIDWQTSSAINVMNTTVYNNGEQQNQLCSFG